MGVFLSHLDLSPVLYGIIMWLGLGVMLIKILKGRWLSLVVDVTVFVLVFKLHGGTMAGGFSAMICALLAGLFFPTLIKRMIR